MRWIAAMLMVAVVLAFAPLVQAEKTTKAHKPHLGTVVSVSKDKLTYSSTNKKGAVKEHHVKIDASTKITLDGKVVSLSDLKPGLQVAITSEHGKAATEVAATSGAGAAHAGASAQ